MAVPQRSGQLTEQEQASLEAILQQCYAKKLLEKPVDGLHNDANDGLDDRTILLRYLRGHSFNVDAAVKKFGEALAIRRSVDAAATYDSINVHDFETTRQLYPHWSGRRDKAGLPICVFDVADLDHETIQGYAKSNSMSNPAGQTTGSEATSRAVVFHDYLTRFIMPLCTTARDRQNPETPITSAVYLVDIAKFNFKQAWGLRSYAQDASHLLATCYPEVVERVYVLNASSYFSKVWNLMSRWIEPRTASKLVIVSAPDVLETLQATIDLESIPSRYGGKCDFEHGMTPVPDEGLSQTVAWSSPIERLPTGPIKWAADENGVKTLTAVGTADGGRRKHHLGNVKQ